MGPMAKKLMTFKHWKTGEVKTSEFRDAEEPANPSSERLVVRNKTEQKLEDLIKPTIVETREELFKRELLCAIRRFAMRARP